MEKNKAQKTVEAFLENGKFIKKICIVSFEGKHRKIYSYLPKAQIEQISLVGERVRIFTVSSQKSEDFKFSEVSIDESNNLIIEFHAKGTSSIFDEDETEE